MHRSKTYDPLEIYVVGPLALEASDTRLLLWLAKSGDMALGSIKLHWEHSHTAQIRDLQLSSENMRSRQAHSAKLIGAVAEYAREHGILKIKVHRNSRSAAMLEQLIKVGFSDAARTSDDMQFYLDLYKPMSKRLRPQAVRPEGNQKVHAVLTVA